MDDTTSLEALKQAVRDFCEQRDWDPFHTPKDLAIGVVTEAAELLEHFRFQSDEQQLAVLADPQHRTEVVEEVADVLMFVLRFAQRFDIDLAQAVRAKLQTNAAKYPIDVARGVNTKYTRLSDRSRP